MRAVNINTTEGKLLVSIPTYFKELTLGQLIELKNEQLSNVEVISVLSNIPLSTLYLARDITAFDIFTNSINSLAQEILNVYDATALPKEITFRYLDGKAARKTVKVISNLSIEPVGAFLNCRNIIAEEINLAINKFGEENWKQNFHPSLESALTILSQYFYCRVTGQVYNEYKVEEFQNDVKYLYAYEALPIARTFFLSYPHLKTTKKSFWQLIIAKSKLLRELKILKGLAQ